MLSRGYEEHDGEMRGEERTPAVRRRALVLGLLATSLALLAAFDAAVAAGPAFGLSFAAAWLVRT